MLQQYAASVATRGIMHSNTARARSNATGGSLGWKPIHKPQCYSYLLYCFSPGQCYSSMWPLLLLEVSCTLIQLEPEAMLLVVV